MSLFLEDPTWVPPSSFPELTGDVGVDLEVRDTRFNITGPGWPQAAKRPGSVSPEDGYVVGLAMSWREGNAIEGGYWPIRHGGGGNLDPGRVLAWARAQLTKPDVRPVFANAPYDLGWLLAEGIDITDKPYDDVMIMAPLINENLKSFALDALAKEYLTDERKANKELDAALAAYGLKGKGDLWKLPAPHVGPYGQQDAVLNLKLLDRYRPIMNDEDLMRAYAVEIGINPMLIQGRARGVRVDVEGAHALAKAMVERERVAKENIRRITGKAIDPWENDAIAAAFRARGADLRETAGGKDSVAKDFLATSKDPLAKEVLEARRWSKAQQFVDNHILGHQHRGRVHAQFSQLRRNDEGRGEYGTVSHRFSCSDPNLQQLPSLDRDEEVGRAVRGLLLPEEGETWAAVDWASQEPRLMCHYAELAKAPGGKEAADRYRANPKHDFYKPIVDFTGMPRKAMKILTLARAYGAKDGKTCQQLGYPTEPHSFEKNGKTITYQKAGPEGRAVIDRFDEIAPFIKSLVATCEEKMKRRGYLICPFDGARFRVPEIEGFHKSFNRLVQGTAARQMKKAMWDVHRAGLSKHFLATVHDELGFSVPNPEIQAELVRIMETAYDIGFPTLADVEVGPSWGATAKIDA